MRSRAEKSIGTCRECRLPDCRFSVYFISAEKATKAYILLTDEKAYYVRIINGFQSRLRSPAETQA